MPARKIPKNYRNVTGVVAARKAQGEAAFESALERDFLILLDFDPMVQSFEVQPVTIHWTDPTRNNRSYTLDCLVHFEDEHQKAILFEVKYRNEFWREWPQMRPKYRAAVHYGNLVQRRFRIVTEKEVRTQYLENARFLTPFVRREPESPALIERLIKVITELQQSTPNDLLATLSHDRMEQALFMPALWFLIGTFKIGVDLWQPLNMKSKIWAVHRSAPHLA